MNDDVDLSIRQFRDAWRMMCAASPGHELASTAGIEYSFSGLPIGFFNVALLTGRGVSGDALKAHGDHACRWAADKQVPWLFIVTDEALEAGTDAVEVLDGCGLAPIMPLTGMTAEHVSPATRVPEGLALTVPQDESDCSALLDINSRAYGMDLDAAKAVLGRPDFWTGHVPVLGTVGHTPVSSAAVMMVDGYRYVALVATDPAQQRRGYADAAMRQALQLAGQAHGARPTVLHATDAGRPVYQRMGYTTIATHTVFMEQRFLH